MADILGRAARQQFYNVTPKEMNGLRVEEIRQLHIARLSQLPARPIRTLPTPTPSTLAREAPPAPTQRPRSKGGRKGNPDKAAIYARYEQLVAAGNPSAAKTAAQWARNEHLRPVHSDTILRWAREAHPPAKSTK